MTKKEKQSYFIILLATAGLVAIDLIVKAVLFRGLKVGEDGATIPMIENLFSIERVWNEGASFGILKGQLWFFVIITVTMLSIMGFVYYKQKEKPWLLNLSIVLIFAGALGNFIDRIVFSQVRDMIYVHFFPAVFNVADVFITVGTTILAIYILFFYGKNEKKEVNKT